MAPPYSVVVLDETRSTQDDARTRFHGDPVLVVAGRQTAGRGRSGAGWENAPRAMAASLATGLGDRWPPEAWGRIPLAAGVAAARVVDADLKWPNDVMRGDDKLGGVLVEASDRTVVVGFGLNLWWPDAPEGRAGLLAEDPGPDRATEIATSWADQLLEMLDRGPDGFPLDEYRIRCRTLGREVTWGPGGTGTALDVDRDGSLVVETGSGVVRLRSGEVRHLRLR